MILNSLYSHHKGVGASTYTSSLPEQTLSDKQKTDTWKKSVMDRLESIAMSQISKNIEFRDYYKMVEGRLVYSDFESPPEIVKDIVSLREEMDLPTYIKHYDLIGLIANQLAGELDNNKDKLRVDSTDEFSENEYIRSKTEMLNQYQRAKFESEIKRGLAMKGIDPDSKQEFESEEQQQQYLQFIQEESNKIVSPEEIERNLSKNFKVKAAEWGEKTLEADRINFGINHLEEQEFIDYFLTGRYFRHFHVGYDYYKPERWDVETTFFSQDSSIKYPQDGEYVGRMTWMSSSEILTRFGSKLPYTIQKKIGGTYDVGNSGTPGDKYDATSSLKRPVGSAQVPHKDYFDHKMNLELQEAFDRPLGESTYIDENGNEFKTPEWLSDYAKHDSYFGSGIARHLRDDIDVRRDSFRVTEAYFKSQKRVAYIRYETPAGIIAEEMITDDILKDFIRDNGIKVLKTISPEDFERGDEVNVLTYTFVPEVWEGKKIGAGGLLSEDIYFDIKPLEYQIKGEGNIYDIKLPVTGVIGSSNARKIRPYQMGYNLCMNQIFNLLEKEIGMFFLLDINFLPSEFKDMGDSAETLAHLRDLARDLGFMPVDTSRQNLQGQNPQGGQFHRQEISYDVQIQRRAAMADMYKRLTLEQIGITEQRKGSPDQYATTEGIKVGQEASYAQTRLIFSVFNEARRRSTVQHLNIAQFCQSNNKEISVFSRKSDGDMSFLKFTDELFSLRELGVTAVSDSKSRQSLERLREVLLSNNTAGSDILDFAEIMVSDSMIELTEIGRRSRAKAQAEMQAEREHESNLEQQRIQAAAEEAESLRKHESLEAQKDRAARLEAERIKALGRASDKESDQHGFDEINRAADLANKKEFQDKQIELKGREVEMKENESAVKQKVAQETLRLKLLELKDKREQRQHEKFVAVTNKN